ncbi:hypothetical protein GCM10022224_070860 [Nonomuraea antimicrobica]|uniref:Transposase n=1 Tax=Nonomuraea antimicrobica TaxID=561173 RepID=A0ABP7CVS2_9ACTN
MTVARLNWRPLTVSRSTIYKYVPELKPGSGGQIEVDVPAPRPELTPGTG